MCGLLGRGPARCPFWMHLRCLTRRRGAAGSGADPEREHCARSLPLPTQRVGAEPAGFREEAVVLCWDRDRCGEVALAAGLRLTDAAPRFQAGRSETSNTARAGVPGIQCDAYTDCLVGVSSSTMKNIEWRLARLGFLFQPTGSGLSGDSVCADPYWTVGGLAFLATSELAN